ncbi:zinc finger ccch-type-containing 11a [Anaeramoeba flamelloides]|uniref:Zinc finger ccch-type-containing 11a n=1 Tax=Anaeramoeba flamelloides TaxID=1746091 RepID=A0ABQ8YRQ0_9EUKA|nr:zinc finger ccch-type-containing 11a [Anaeramoeba flamelloides]
MFIKPRGIPLSHVGYNIFYRPKRSRNIFHSQESSTIIQWVRDLLQYQEITYDDLFAKGCLYLVNILNILRPCRINKVSRTLTETKQERNNFEEFVKSLQSYNYRKVKEIKVGLFQKRDKNTIKEVMKSLKWLKHKHEKHGVIKDTTKTYRQFSVLQSTHKQSIPHLHLVDSQNYQMRKNTANTMLHNDYVNPYVSIEKFDSDFLVNSFENIFWLDKEERNKIITDQQIELGYGEIRNHSEESNEENGGEESQKKENISDLRINSQYIQKVTLLNTSSSGEVNIFSSSFDENSNSGSVSEEQENSEEVEEKEEKEAKEEEEKEPEEKEEKKVKEEEEKKVDEKEEKKVEKKVEEKEEKKANEKEEKKIDEKEEKKINEKEEKKVEEKEEKKVKEKEEKKVDEKEEKKVDEKEEKKVKEKEEKKVEEKEEKKVKEKEEKKVKEKEEKKVKEKEEKKVEEKEEKKKENNQELKLVKDQEQVNKKLHQKKTKEKTEKYHYKKQSRYENIDFTNPKSLYLIRNFEQATQFRFLSNHNPKSKIIIFFLLNSFNKWKNTNYENIKDYLKEKLINYYHTLIQKTFNGDSTFFNNKIMNFFIRIEIQDTKTKKKIKRNSKTEELNEKNKVGKKKKKEKQNDQQLSNYQKISSKVDFEKKEKKSKKGIKGDKQIEDSSNREEEQKADPRDLGFLRLSRKRIRILLKKKNQQILNQTLTNPMRIELHKKKTSALRISNPKNTFKIQFLSEEECIICLSHFLYYLSFNKKYMKKHFANKKKTNILNWRSKKSKK